MVENTGKFTRLEGHWASLMQACQSLGKIHTCVQNEALQLTSYGCLATNVCTSLTQQASESRIRLTTDYLQWGHVLGSTGVHHGEVTVFGKDGCRELSLIGVGDPQKSRLRCIIRQFDASLSEAGHACPVAQPTMPSWKAETRLRYQRLRDSKQAMMVHESSLNRLLTETMQHRLPIRLCVANSLAMLGRDVQWQTVGKKGSVIWARDAFNVLRLHANQLGVAWIVASSCACCGENCPSLECYHHCGELQFILQNTKETNDTTWRALLAEFYQSCRQ